MGTANSSGKVSHFVNTIRAELSTHPLCALDEADIFDSDFGSTDEGSAPEDDLDGEKRLEREAKLERRVSTSPRSEIFFVG